MATSLQRHPNISWPSQESYRSQLGREGVFRELERPGIAEEVHSLATIPATKENVKSNARIVGTRVVYNHSVPGLDRQVGALVWIQGQPGNSKHTTVQPVANWAGPNRTVNLADLKEVNQRLAHSDESHNKFEMQSWRLDGVLVSNAEVDERLVDGAEHTTSALLVAFQGPTRIKNMFSYKPMVQDVFYVALVCKHVDGKEHYVWKPCSSQMFTDPASVANLRLMHRSANAAVLPPVADEGPLDLLSVEDIPHVVGAYKVGQVLDGGAGRCTVDVDVAWVSVFALRRLYGPSPCRLKSERLCNEREWNLENIVEVPTKSVFTDEKRRKLLQIRIEDKILTTKKIQKMKKNNPNNAYLLGRDSCPQDLFIGPGYGVKKIEALAKPDGAGKVDSEGKVKEGDKGHGGDGHGDKGDGEKKIEALAKLDEAGNVDSEGDVEEGDVGEGDQGDGEKTSNTISNTLNQFKGNEWENGEKWDRLSKNYLDELVKRPLIEYLYPDTEAADKSGAIDSYIEKERIIPMLKMSSPLVNLSLIGFLDILQGAKDDDLEKRLCDICDLLFEEKIKHGVMFESEDFKRDEIFKDSSRGLLARHVLATEQLRLVVAEVYIKSFIE